MAANSLIDEFLQVVNDIVAVFVDARDGFHALQDQLVVEAEASGYETPVVYRDPSTGSVAVSTTLADRIGRNARDAENSTFIGNMAIVAIYSYWEDHYRGAIAKALGKKKNEVASPVMGDLRHFRTSIVHNRSIAISDVERCSVLKFFVPGEEIFFNEPMFIELVAQVHGGLGQLRE